MNQDELQAAFAKLAEAPCWRQCIPCGELFAGATDDEADAAAAEHMLGEHTRAWPPGETMPS